MDTIDKYKKINFNHLAKGLGGLRRMRGITLDELSFYTKKDIAYLSRLENGKASPKFETLSIIWSFYSLTAKEFFDMLDKFI
jgi:transcriptional regulator with XRE-family HTH domain